MMIADNLLEMDAQFATAIVTNSLGKAIDGVVSKSEAERSVMASCVTDSD